MVVLDGPIATLAERYAQLAHDSPGHQLTTRDAIRYGIIGGLKLCQRCRDNPQQSSMLDLALLQFDLEAHFFLLDLALTPRRPPITHNSIAVAIGHYHRRAIPSAALLDLAQSFLDTHATIPGRLAADGADPLAHQYALYCGLTAFLAAHGRKIAADQYSVTDYDRFCLKFKFEPQLNGDPLPRHLNPESAYHLPNSSATGYPPPPPPLSDLPDKGSLIHAD